MHFSFILRIHWLCNAIRIILINCRFYLIFNYFHYHLSYYFSSFPHPTRNSLFNGTNSLKNVDDRVQVKPVADLPNNTANKYIYYNKYIYKYIFINKYKYIFPPHPRYMVATQVATLLHRGGGVMWWRQEGVYQEGGEGVG